MTPAPEQDRTDRSPGSVPRAINDIFSVLPRSDSADAAISLQWQPAVFCDNGRDLLPFPLRHGTAPAPEQQQAAQTLLQREPGATDQQAVSFALSGDFLVVRLSPGGSQMRSLFAVLSDRDLHRFLSAHFPKVPLTRAIERVLFLLLAGIGLSAGAAHDNRAVDTRKRQSQQLRAAFGGADLMTIVQTVSAALIMVLERLLNFETPGVSTALMDYVDRFLPPRTRLYALSDASGTAFPMLDLGPPDGRPILCLHPMALPDIRPKDIGHLERLNLRLIWPLRHGTCAPHTEPLSFEAHLEHALRGADLALNALCGGRATVLAFAAASKLGVLLARARPNAVLDLHVAGACVREGRPLAGPRRLAKGVLALAEKDPEQLDAVLRAFEQQLRDPDTFALFLKNQFADSPADLRVIEAEANGPHGLARFRDALLDSAASARHDFLFQIDLGWDDTPDDLHVVLHHGAMDAIHPLPLIQSLAGDLPHATLVPYPAAGQLFCHEHFADLWSNIASTQAEGLLHP